MLPPHFQRSVNQVGYLLARSGASRGVSEVAVHVPMFQHRQSTGGGVVESENLLNSVELTDTDAARND